MKKRVLFFLLLYLLGWKGFAQDYSTNEKIFWLSKIWKDVATNYCDPQHLGKIKWDSLYLDYIPKTMNTQDDYSFYLLLNRFISTIKDGHTEFNCQKYIFSNEAFDYLPIELDFLEGKYYVSAIRKSLVSNISLGSQVLKINDVEIDMYLKEHIFPYISAGTIQDKRRKALMYLTRGNANDSIKFKIESIGKGDSTVILKYNMIREKVKRNDMIATFTSDFNNWSRTDAYMKKDQFNNDFFYLRFDRFHKSNISNLMNEIEEEVARSDYIVLDLRYNRGGNELEADSLLMCFLDIDTLQTYPSVTRINNAYYAAQGYGYKQYREYYNEGKLDTLSADYMQKGNLPSFKQPLFILIGDRTFSAAEDLLISLKLHFPQRAKLVGTSTGGSTGAPLVRVLPYHQAYYRICTRKPLVSDNIWNHGIQPDYYYVSDIDGILKEKDTIFEYVATIYNRK